jgi:hypothetical protein
MIAPEQTCPERVGDALAAGDLHAVCERARCCPTVGAMGVRPNPAHNLSAIGALARFEPDRAREAIVAAFVDAEGVGVRAAAALGISYRNLTRLVAKLGLGERIDAECVQRGFIRHQGAPRGVQPAARRRT